MREGGREGGGGGGGGRGEGEGLEVVVAVEVVFAVEVVVVVEFIVIVIVISHSERKVMFGFLRLQEVLITAKLTAIAVELAVFEVSCKRKGQEIIRTLNDSSFSPKVCCSESGITCVEQEIAMNRFRCWSAMRKKLKSDAAKYIRSKSEVRPALTMIRQLTDHCECKSNLGFLHF